MRTFQVCAMFHNLQKLWHPFSFLPSSPVSQLWSTKTLWQKGYLKILSITLLWCVVMKPNEEIKLKPHLAQAYVISLYIRRLEKHQQNYKSMCTDWNGYFIEWHQHHDKVSQPLWYPLYLLARHLEFSKGSSAQHTKWSTCECPLEGRPVGMCRGSRMGGRTGTGPQLQY